MMTLGTDLLPGSRSEADNLFRKRISFVVRRRSLPISPVGERGVTWVNNYTGPEGTRQQPLKLSYDA